MPVTISGGSFGSRLSSNPDTRDAQKDLAQAQLNKIRDQVDAGTLKRGSKAVREKLNELEKMGIATFGTGLRGFADVAGSGGKAYTRSQLGRLRGALYDPSQRDFDEAGTQVAGQELSQADYEDYIKGRDERLKDTLLGKGIATLAGMFNPIGTGIKTAQEYLGEYLPFLQATRPEYYGLLQPGLRQQNQQVLPATMLAGIGSLPMNNVETIDPKTIMENFQLKPNEVTFDDPVVAGSDIINSNELYPVLNYPTLNRFV
tara:strand:+ start:486 stop:1262 length:777 start_codon:yes stop_codon:yes gene_type:complete